MKNKKPLIGMIAIILLLAAVVYLNIKLGSADSADIGVTEGAVQNSDMSVESLSTSLQEEHSETVNYFESFREQRDAVRNQEIHYLDEVIEASSSDDETLKDAGEQKLTLISNMEKEFTIESLVKAKGFADAAVTFHKGSVNVIIDCKELTNEQVAQVLDIVQRETDESADNIKITSSGG